MQLEQGSLGLALIGQREFVRLTIKNVVAGQSDILFGYFGGYNDRPPSCREIGGKFSVDKCPCLRIIEGNGGGEAFWNRLSSNQRSVSVRGGSFLRLHNVTQ